MSIHDQLLKELREKWPTGSWESNEKIGELTDHIAGMKPNWEISFAFRSNKVQDLVSSYDQDYIESYPYIENSTLTELLLDLDIYRKKRNIPSTEAMVLLIALKHHSLEPYNFLKTEDGNLIINTDRMTITQMVDLITSHNT
jgi:hypothetical protein